MLPAIVTIVWAGEHELVERALLPRLQSRAIREVEQRMSVGVVHDPKAPLPACFLGRVEIKRVQIIAVHGRHARQTAGSEAPGDTLLHDVLVRQSEGRRLAVPVRHQSLIAGVGRRSVLIIISVVGRLQRAMDDLLVVRVRVEIMGSQTCGIVGQSQSVLIMIRPIIFTCSS
jgi:hypothetical protein